RLSIIDPLTGAYNRRHLMEQLPLGIARAARYGRPLSVIMCDGDCFKAINDTHGHLCGDAVLSAMVARLRGAIRAFGWIARYGGEEFVVVLAETNVAGAAVTAELLRQCVGDTPFASPAGPLAVSASFGVSGWRENVPSGSSLD